MADVHIIRNYVIVYKMDHICKAALKSSKSSPHPAARHNVVWSAGRSKLKYLALDDGQLDLGDVSVVMEERCNLLSS